VTSILGSGLAFPLQLDRRGSLALAHEETDVAQAIGLVLSTAPGERPMRPEFGCAVADYVFERIDARLMGRIEHDVRAALERWEPRVDVLDVMFDESRVSQGELRIDIRYRIRATNAAYNLVYPFYVIPEEETT
jgi:phage baseplate assembly protein W